MSVLGHCLNLQYSATVTLFVTNSNRHALALQTARQTEFDGNLIRFTLLNWFESIIPSSSCRRCSTITSTGSSLKITLILMCISLPVESIS